MTKHNFPEDTYTVPGDRYRAMEDCIAALEEIATEKKFEPGYATKADCFDAAQKIARVALAKLKATP